MLAVSNHGESLSDPTVRSHGPHRARGSGLTGPLTRSAWASSRQIADSHRGDGSQSASVKAISGALGSYPGVASPGRTALDLSTHDPKAALLRDLCGGIVREVVDDDDLHLAVELLPLERVERARQSGRGVARRNDDAGVRQRG